MGWRGYSRGKVVVVVTRMRGGGSSGSWCSVWVCAIPGAGGVSVSEDTGGFKEGGGCEGSGRVFVLGFILCRFHLFPLLCLYCCTFTVGLGYQGVRCYLHLHPALRAGVSGVLSLYIPYHHAVFEILETRDSRLCINNISHTVVDPLRPSGCFGAEKLSGCCLRMRGAYLFLSATPAESSQLRRARSGPVVEPRSSLSWHRRTIEPFSDPKR